jgi:hypothetical protein
MLSLLNLLSWIVGAGFALVLLLEVSEEEAAGADGFWIPLTFPCCFDWIALL